MTESADGAAQGGMRASTPTGRRGSPTNLKPGGIRTLPIALAGGVVAALAFEPVGHGWLAPLAMAMFWISVTRSHWRSALIHGACFGFTFMGVLLWWLVDSVGAGAWVLLVATQTLAAVAAAAGIHAVSRLPAGPVWAGAVWVLVESTRSTWPLGGLPWGRLGITAIDTPWVTLLPYVGIPGTGFVVAAAGFAFGGLVTRHRGSDLVVVRAVMMSFAATVAPSVAPHEGTFRIAVIQGGVPGDGRDVAGNHRQVTDNHVQQTRELAQRIAAGETPAPDLIVWPENSTAVDPLRDRATRGAIDEAVSEVGIPILIGGVFDGPDDATAYNRGIVWLPDGEIGPAYTKTHPVPFGEYIPWRSVIGGWSSRFQLIPRDFLPGSGEGPLDVAGIKVADAICFDVAYDDALPDQVRRGAQLVAVQTSNATFYETYQPEQQFEITRARAVELNRSVAVASTNGISAIIDPSGRVLVRSAEGSGAVAITDVPIVDAITPAVRFQTRLTLLLSGLAIGGLLWCAARSSRRRRVRVGIASYRQGERRPAPSAAWNPKRQWLVLHQRNPRDSSDYSERTAESLSAASSGTTKEKNRMVSSRTRRWVVSVALAVLTVVYALDQLLTIEWPDDAVWPLRLLLLLAAVVIAGIAFQAWSAGKPQELRPLTAMSTSLIGGASLASAATSGGSDTAFGSGALGAVSLVALAFGVIVLNIDGREKGNRS